MRQKEGRISERALKIADRELKKQKKEKVTELLLLSFALFSTTAVFALLTANFIATGFATYVPAEAGYITELNVTVKYQTSYWHGLYGLALRVPGYTDPLFEDVYSGELSSKGLFFDCMQQDATGGREIYASLSPTIDFDSLAPANASEIDAYTGCGGGSVDCATNTFLDTMWIMVGLTNITGIPSTHTYRWDGNYGVFDLGILVDGGDNLVYVTHVEDLQKGYSPDTTVNFQMLLPTRPASEETYYFFTDPYDECPAGGGIGEVIPAIVYGYVRDPLGDPIENITVVVEGENYTTNSTGYYNISVGLLEGIHSLFAYGAGYDEYFSNITVNFTNYTVNKNITMSVYTPGLNETISPFVWGYVINEGGTPISSANVYLGGDSTVTDEYGYYNLTPELVPQQHPIIVTSPGYNNYYSLLNFSSNTTSLNHNVTLILANLGQNNNPYLTGPYTQRPNPRILQEAEKTGEDFWISTKEIYKEIRQNTFVEDTLGIYNFRSTNMNVLLSISSELSDIVKLNRDAVLIAPGTGEDVVLTFYGTKPIGTYEGTLKISGDLEKEIPITIKIVEKKMPIETLLLAIDLFDNIINPGSNLNYKLTLQNLLVDQGYKVSLEMLIMGETDSTVYYRETREVEIQKSLSLVDSIKIPSNFSEGDYLFVVNAKYFGFSSSVTAPFSIRKPIYLYSFLGIPLWIFFVIFAFASFILLNIFVYKK